MHVLAQTKLFTFYCLSTATIWCSLYGRTMSYHLWYVWRKGVFFLAQNWHFRPCALSGMNKMVVNHLEKLFVSSDAQTIVRELEVRERDATFLSSSFSGRNKNLCCSSFVCVHVSQPSPSCAAVIPVDTPLLMCALCACLSSSQGSTSSCQDVGDGVGDDGARGETEFCVLSNWFKVNIFQSLVVQYLFWARTGCQCICWFCQTLTCQRVLSGCLIVGNQSSFASVLLAQATAVEKRILMEVESAIFRRCERQHAAYLLVILFWVCILWRLSYLSCVQCGDGTNFVLILAGTLLSSAEDLLRMVRVYCLNCSEYTVCPSDIYTHLSVQTTCIFTSVRWSSLCPFPYSKALGYGVAAAYTGELLEWFQESWSRLE